MKLESRLEAWAEINSNGTPADRMRAFLNSNNDAYAILQLNRTSEVAREIFLSLDALHRKGLEPKEDHYEVVYLAPLPPFHNLDDMLEGLYTKFNIAHPVEYRGHSLSVSDVIALRQNGVMSFHYVDSVGFQKLHDFIKEAQREAMQQSFSERLAMGQQLAQEENITYQQTQQTKVTQKQR